MKIFFVNGERAGTTMDFDMMSITVGREVENVLSLDAGGVSRFHGRIFCQDGKWFVEDFDSTNGVKVNTMLIVEAYELHNGDLVAFGDQIFRVSDLDEPESPVFEEEAEAEPEMKTELFDMAGELSEALKQGAAKIFSGGSSKTPENGGEPRQEHRIMSNRLFYTVVLCLSVVAISGFYIFVTTPEKNTGSVAAKKEKASDFLLYYEKELYSPDNIFRFVLHIENCKAVFTIDDLKSSRHFQRTLENLNESALEPLRSRVERSGFMLAEKPQKGSAPVNSRERRRLVIGTAGALNDVEVINNHAPESFEEMEGAISLFADNYGLQTISMTPAELMEQAESCFVKAEELFANRAAGLKNLRDAILRYQIAVDCMEQFSPKPALWNRARKQLELAERLRNQKYKDLDFEHKRLLRFRDFESLRTIYVQQMDLCDPDSKEYNLARDRIFKLDRHLNRVRKRR